MKIRYVILTIATLLFAGAKSNAQASEDSRVKILPTITPGVIKVHYAMETDAPLEVKFIADGVIRTDRIKKGHFPKGLSKRYDVTKVKDKDFRIEVISPRMAVTYYIVRSKDRQTFEPYIERTIYNNQLLVKANN